MHGGIGRKVKRNKQSIDPVTTYHQLSFPAWDSADTNFASMPISLLRDSIILLINSSETGLCCKVVTELISNGIVV